MAIKHRNKYIRWMREDRRISQEKMAKMLGMTTEEYAKMEESNQRPDIDILIQISRMFGVSVDDMLGAEKLQEKLPFYVRSGEPGVMTLKDIARATPHPPTEKMAISELNGEEVDLVLIYRLLTRDEQIKLVRSAERIRRESRKKALEAEKEEENED